MHPTPLYEARGPPAPVRFASRSGPRRALSQGRAGGSVSGRCVPEDARRAGLACELAVPPTQMEVAELWEVVGPCVVSIMPDELALSPSVVPPPPALALWHASPALGIPWDPAHPKGGLLFRRLHHGPDAHPGHAGAV